MIVGIPGVGKSTVVAKVLEILQAKGRPVQVVNYGSTMMEQAVKIHNVKSRDEMRRLPIEAQRSLQVHAAARIAEITGKTVIVDTHLFILTNEGFWPGIPMDVLRALDPTNLVLVEARAEEVQKRRTNDLTRARDPATEESLERELSAARTLLLASTVISGCPALIVENPEGGVDSAAMRIIGAIESN